METAAPAPAVAGASITGASHAERQLGCQDSFAFRVQRQTVVLAVCDGLGSASLSGLAAERAAFLAVAQGELEVGTKEPEEVVRLMAEAARVAIEVLSEEREVDVSELATTFIGCVIDNGSVTAAHIGDGAAVAASESGFVIVSPPEDSEYVNEVTPLSSENWRDHLRISRADGVSAVCLFTDGVQRACLIKGADGWEPLQGFFEPLFSHVGQGGDSESIEVFLSGPRMGEVSDDDKTLLIASLVPCTSSIEPAAV